MSLLLQILCFNKISLSFSVQKLFWWDIFDSFIFLTFSTLLYCCVNFLQKNFLSLCDCSPFELHFHRKLSDSLHLTPSSMKDIWNVKFISFSCSCSQWVDLCKNSYLFFLVSSCFLFLFCFGLPLVNSHHQCGGSGRATIRTPLLLHLGSGSIQQSTLHSVGCQRWATEGLLGQWRSI